MTTANRPTLNDLYAPIASERAAFTQRLEKELSSQDALIRGIHEHLLKMTGKFLRPMLAVLCSRLEDKRSDEVIPLAVAIELIHTATLVHDDIIDDSLFRRNQPSVHSKWGREISIVAGDYLYAKAFMLLSGFKDTRIQQAFATCAHVMCEGEMKQIERRNHFMMEESEYLRIIHKKTAALFQAACMGGAYFSGMDLEQVERLGRYGYGLGMAFQIVDDCLDLVGETEILGKKAGLDIHKNEVTLPLLYLYSELTPEERSTLTAETIKSLAVERKAVWRAMQKAREYAENAAGELRPLRESPCKESLRLLTEHCIERVR